MFSVWEYKDATGITRMGVMLGYSDFGGTDVSYRFHRLDENDEPTRYENGAFYLDIVSGVFLKDAKRIGSMVFDKPLGRLESF